jgi:tetratricopeptide (TPR) repeat protein
MNRRFGRGTSVIALVVTFVTASVFWRTTGFPFLNWDDQDILVRNQHLFTSGVVGWAFTTRFIEHYQPLAWISWAAIARTAGLTSASAHGLNVLLHAGAAGLVFLLCTTIDSLSVVRAQGTRRRHWQHGWVVALIATFAWALHPLRVEPVAWASAMPYPLALVFAVAATLAWTDSRPLTAAALFGASLLARPLAFLLPVVFWMTRAPSGRRDRLALASMIVIGIVAAALESSARLTATLGEFGIGPRMTLAAAAPWRYLWRTIWPVDLTPVDPLALTPQTNLRIIVAGAVAIALVSAAAWRWRHRFPVAAVSWAAYLLLLAPAMGLVPSGLQATADRYTYFPAVALSIALADALNRPGARLGSRADHVRSASAALVAIVVVLLSLSTWRQTAFWRDSITLWTRATSLDAANDVAFYNLGTALQDAGRTDEAAVAYEATLRLVPDHEAAQKNLNGLRAAARQREADALAASGNLAAAIPIYRNVLALDPLRSRARAALGIALARTGQYDAAVDELRVAIDQGVDDAAVFNAAGFALVQTGRTGDAVRLLQLGRARHPQDEDIRRNLELITRQ